MKRLVLTMVLPQFFLLPQVADAAALSCAAGDVQCLVDAINQANADPQHKTSINLSGVYTLTAIDNTTDGPNGLPSILSTVTIKGGSAGAALTRQASSSPFRIFHVGASGRLTLRGLTLSNGGGGSGGGLRNNGGVVTIIDSSFTDNGLFGDTGAVYNDHGSMVITRTTFSNNFGNSGAGLTNVGGNVDILETSFENNDGLAAGGVTSVGGDVRVVDSRFSLNSGKFGVGGLRVTGGTASIHGTTFSSNEGDPAGGILVESFASVAIRDSALVENLGVGAGGGIYNANGIVDVLNTTFAGNIVGGVGAFEGSGVFNAGTMIIVNSTFVAPVGRGGDSRHPASTILGSLPTLLRNTIVVHNSDDMFVQDCAGVVTSLGNNLIGDPFPCNMTIQLSDRIGDAGLADLVDDGTPGNAHYPLLPDSQAIDAANKTACPRRDQLGQLRRPRCDIGSVEFEDDPPGANNTK